MVGSKAPCKMYLASTRGARMGAPLTKKGPIVQLGCLVWARSCRLNMLLHVSLLESQCNVECAIPHDWPVYRISVAGLKHFKTTRLLPSSHTTTCTRRPPQFAARSLLLPHTSVPLE
eukprot:5797845-Amphidinium_carterae.1